MPGAFPVLGGSRRPATVSLRVALSGPADGTRRAAAVLAATGPSLERPWPARERYGAAGALRRGRPPPSSSSAPGSDAWRRCQSGTHGLTTADACHARYSSHSSRREPERALQLRSPNIFSVAGRSRHGTSSPGSHSATAGLTGPRRTGASRGEGSMSGTRPRGRNGAWPGFDGTARSGLRCLSGHRLSPGLGRSNRSGLAPGPRWTK